MCHSANPTICGPRHHVQMVFSQRIRAPNKKLKGEAKTHQILRKLGKAPGICMVLHSNAHSVSSCYQAMSLLCAFPSPKLRSKCDIEISTTSDSTIFQTAYFCAFMRP